MGYEIPDGFALAAFQFSITGDPELMVCGLGFDITGFVGDEQACVNAIDGAWVTEMKTSVPNTVTMDDTLLYVGQSSGDPVVYQSQSAPTVGTSSGTSVPPNVAVLIKKQTGTAGRAFRGRMFFPGVSEGLVSPAGVLDSALITQMQGDINSAFAAWVALDLVPVLLHSTGSLTFPTPITSFAIDSKVGSQRRRLR